MDRIWYCIKGFNGYEYSNDGLLRSMKNYKVNPQGKLIKSYFDKNKNKYYKLSDNYNQVQKVYESEIISIIRSDPNPIKRGTFDTDIGSRNKLVPTKKQRSKNEYITPSFTIINEKKNGIFFY